MSGKPLDSLDRKRLGIVEPSMRFLQNTGVMVAKALVDPKTGNICLRLANFSKDPVMVHKNLVTAVLQPVESVGSERNQKYRVCQANESSRDPQNCLNIWYHCLNGLQNIWIQLRELG